MAAQPMFWGTIVERESSASGRTRARREADLPYRQRYRQSQPTEKPRTIVPADLFPGGLAESRLNLAVGSLDDAPAVAESAGRDLLPQILIAIDKLMSPNADDGDPPATEHAYQFARAVVESAYGQFLAVKETQARKLSPPIVTSDERGGVRLSWQRGDKHVRTSFGAAQDVRSYLYFQSPTDHDVEPLKPSNLFARLDWLLQA